jgi:beta-glucosidase-like glycosyl hydrolase
LQQATRINYFQQISKTPILISIDAENGVGMRFDSVAGLSRQMMLGAVQEPALIYEYGRVVGAQCKRIGIQVNYAPVVDINNNPANPVINDRSFGEDKFRVALYGIQYMKGMKDMGILTCAKHFPGHGDVSVDSHMDLPFIGKTRKELDSLELYPFRKMIEAGVDAVMVGHLAVPAMDKRTNRPTSLSNKTINGVLRNELGFGGMVLYGRTGNAGCCKIL